MGLKSSPGLAEISTLRSLFIIFLGSLCCINSYDGAFVFDDSPAIVNNPDVKSTKILKLFQNDFWGNKLTKEDSHRSYRPLTTLTFRLNYLFRGGFNVIDFHIINLILHSLSCLLLYFLYKLILKKDLEHLAFYATLLFAVHPVHTEAVSGIVGRADILCAIFFWLSIIIYHQSIHSSLVYLLASILSITISMLCKEIGITAIGICFVYEIIVVHKKNLLDVLRLFKCSFQWNDHHLMIFIRFFGLLIAALVLIIGRFSLMGFLPPTFQPIDNPASFVDNFFIRHLNYQYIYALNAWLLICPEWLSFDWSMGCVPLIDGWDNRLFIIILFWIVFGLLIFKFFTVENDETTRCIRMGLSLLIIPFLPASNLFFSVGFVIAERTLYIPSAGYCLVITLGLQKLSTSIPKSKLPVTIYTILVMIWFGRCWIRSNHWRTEQSLFRSALSVCPLNAKVHYNVAKNAADMGNISLAEAEYRQALQLHKNYSQAMNNLGNLLKDQKKFKDAEKLFRHAIEIQPDFPAAWMNLGITLASLKQYDESEKCYRTSLAQRRNCPDCYYNLGLLFLERQEYLKALNSWNNTIQLDLYHRRAWTNTIRLLDDMGAMEKAIEEGRKAIKILPDDGSIRHNTANVLGKLERFSEAEKEFKLAIKLDPTNPTIYTNLGVLYHRWNKLDQARELYTKALEINPNNQNALENLRKLMKLLRKKNVR